ncbi:hypothetical protein D3C72_1580930 [compost metagenome]
MEKGDLAHGALPRLFGADHEGVALADQQLLRLLRALLEVAFHVARLQHAADALQIGAEVAVRLDQVRGGGLLFGRQATGKTLEGAVARGDALARQAQRRRVAGIALRDARGVAAQVGAGGHQGQGGGVYGVDLLRGKAVELGDVLVGLAQREKAHAPHQQLKRKKYRDDPQQHRRDAGVPEHRRSPKKAAAGLAAATLAVRAGGGPARA